MKISFSKMDIRSIVDISDCTTWEKISESGAAEITGQNFLNLHGIKLKRYSIWAGTKHGKSEHFRRKINRIFNTFCALWH